jgi:peptidyl-dipeptidase A
MKTIRLLLAAVVAGVLGVSPACGTKEAAAPTAADAKQFLDTVNDTMKKLEVESSQAGWVQQNFITDDTEALQARVNQRVTDAIARYAKAAARFDKVSVPADQRRQLALLKNSLVRARS